MKKLYNEYFSISKHGKIREKVMVARVAFTVLITVFYLTAMSLTAYAYFSCDVSSGANIIRAASFEAEVSIIGPEGGAVEAVKTDSQTYAAVLKEGEYTVELKKSDSSTAKTGFCIVTIGENKYHTQQIGADGGKNTASIKFTVTVTEETNAEFFAHWGTSSYYGDINTDSNQLYITDEAEIYQ